MSTPIDYLGDPNLDPKLRTWVELCSDAVQMVLQAARRLTHGNTDPQIWALSLHGSVIELFSGCVVLARWGEPSGIPILLRSMYEVQVELDNLLRDASYVDYLNAANLKQTTKLMKAGPLREHFEKGRKAEFDELTAELAKLKAKGIEPLHISQRSERVGRRDEYESSYALFCLDAHSNGAALAERHITENAEGVAQIAFFGPYEAERVIMRMNFGLKFLFDSTRWVHGAFQVPAPEIEEFAARVEALRAKG